jgi:purine-nucleoside/S-methyl-5'-thioadenosine phosphorylase / adenosine deaminase
MKYFEAEIEGCRLLNSTVSATDEFLDRWRPAIIKQIHSDIIVDLDRDPARIGDGLTTRRGNVGLAVKAADCLPVFLFSADRIAAIHCGWRSIIKGIVQKAAGLMGDYRYAFGASIGPCCYDVQADVADLFAGQFPDALELREGRNFLDLKKCARRILGEDRLAADLDLCVKCHPEYFFSHRRGDRGKRNYAVIIKY